LATRLSSSTTRIRMFGMVLTCPAYFISFLSV
jgi:hypothetical protein